jgi:hypothetical protein
VKKLFSRKDKDAGTPGKAKPAERGGLSIARLNLIPLVVSVLLVLASGYAAYLQFAAQVSERQQEKHAGVARELAAEFAGRLQAMSDELERLARPDALLLAAIAEGNEALLRQREAALSTIYPDALRIRYIPPSEQDPNTALIPRLSYACLDLARKAEAGKRPPFEVHLFGNEQQHLDLVRPVLDGTTPVASLMVTLDVSVLKQWLDAIKPKQGYVELLQGRGEDALSLFGTGEAALKGQGPVYLAPVALSSWQVSYHPGSALGMAEAQQLGFLATFGVAAALLLAFFIFFNLFLSGFLRTDLKRLVGFIVDSSLGKRFHSYPVRLAESKKVLQEKEMDLSVLSSHASVKGPSARGSTKPEHDHIPDLTFVSGNSLAVEEGVGHDGKRVVEENSEQKNK